MGQVFNKLIFKKLNPGKIVKSKGGMVFKKLTVVEADTPPPPIIGLSPDKFNLRLIPLKPGTYELMATVAAPSLALAESDFSKSVEYTVE